MSLQKDIIAKTETILIYKYCIKSHNVTL